MLVLLNLVTKTDSDLLYNAFFAAQLLQRSISPCVNRKVWTTGALTNCWSEALGRGRRGSAGREILSIVDAIRRETDEEFLFF